MSQQTLVVETLRSMGRICLEHDPDVFRSVLDRIGDKWSLLVIFVLKGRPAFRARFSDLKRSIPGISQRMLTATVRNLESDGMLTRHVYAEVPPRVEYELTPLGRVLTEPVLRLVSWLQSNWPVIRSARDRFDARKKRPERLPGQLLLQQSAADDRACGGRRSGRSGRAGARRLQGCGPPQQIVDQPPGGRLQFGQSSIDIAALVVSP